MGQKLFGHRDRWWAVRLGNTGEIWKKTIWKDPDLSDVHLQRIAVYCKRGLRMCRQNGIQVI